MPRVISRGEAPGADLARAPGLPVACVEVSAPTDRSGTLAPQAQRLVSAGLAEAGAVRIGTSACDYRVRLTVVENVDGQRRVIAHTLVASVSLALRGGAEARPIATAAADRAASAETRRTLATVAGQADTWERFVGSAVQIAGATPLAASLRQLATRLHETLIAPTEASLDGRR